MFKILEPKRVFTNLKKQLYFETEVYSKLILRK